MQPITGDKFQYFTKEELIVLLKGEQDIARQLMREIARLRALNNKLETQNILIGEQYVTIKGKMFGKSSERSRPKPSQQMINDHERSQQDKKKKVQLPSLRYPDVDLIEQHIEFTEVPKCKCCGENLKDSGMTEDSEELTIIPEQYLVVRYKRHKYNCGKCHGDLQTAPVVPKIKQGSSLSDDLIIDASLSKYCDLIPMERYAAMADRQGLPDLPPQTLIEGSHYLADYVEPAVELIEQEVLESKTLNADETPHRMLEGDKKQNWFLWGFSNETACYFELKNTRSGDVASETLKKSKCEFLMSDVFSGYAKAVKDTNLTRPAEKQIKNIYCNAHARRKFNEAKEAYPAEAEFYLEQYRHIYRLDGDPPDRRDRSQLLPYFEHMKTQAWIDLAQCPEKSSLSKAINYFLKNYKELTCFAGTADLPIDNNSQERLLRNPVIGRKTWYGTHSKRGAKTAAIMFSIVETCKLNKVNPREYLPALVSAMHAGQRPFTPVQFKNATLV